MLFALVVENSRLIGEHTGGIGLWEKWDSRQGAQAGE